MVPQATDHSHALRFAAYEKAAPPSEAVPAAAPASSSAGVALPDRKLLHSKLAYVQRAVRLVCEMVTLARQVAHAASRFLQTCRALVLLLVRGGHDLQHARGLRTTGAGGRGMAETRLQLAQRAAWCAITEICVRHASGVDHSRRMGLEDNGAPGGRSAAEAEPQLALRAPPAGARRWGPAQFAPTAPAAAPTAATPGARGSVSARSCCPAVVQGMRTSGAGMDRHNSVSPRFPRSCATLDRMSVWRLSRSARSFRQEE